MTLEDPFYVVKDEVFKALNKTRGLYLRWQELAQAAPPLHSPEAEWTSTELKNALRSIEWDLDDLEDTISIVEKNTSKFKIDNKEITERRKFIDNTRKEVKDCSAMIYVDFCLQDGASQETETLTDAINTITKDMKHAVMLKKKVQCVINLPEGLARRLTFSDSEDDEGSPHAPLITSGGSPWETPQQELRRFGDQNVENELATSAANLLKISRTINEELDHQDIVIDSFSQEVEASSSHMNSARLLASRVQRFSPDRRQWMAIGALVMLVGGVLLMFVLL